MDVTSDLILNLAQAPPAPSGGSDNPVLNAIIWVGEHFIGLFTEAGKQFAGLVTGILPTLIVLLTFMYAVIAFIGEDRVTRAVQWSGRYMITRYSIMPVLAVLMLTNPMAYTFGRFLRERHKPAFYDSAVSFVHPVTTFFPTPTPASCSSGSAWPTGSPSSGSRSSRSRSATSWSAWWSSSSAGSPPS